ncbi:MAG: InlB B-repeat-containing protein [Paludibacteraceae bacterium]|nr:InlB B-repeat-containing protein [Paludibacteraceae bacterium]
MKANLATSLIAYARGGMRKQLLVLCLLTLCVGNMWGGDFTVYVTGEIFTGTGDNAWDNQKSEIKVDVRYKGNDYDFKDGDVDWNKEMTCTDYTYNGYPIYSYTFTPKHSGGQFRFKHFKNGDWKEDYTSDWHQNTEQIYRGYYNGGHQWMVYGRDVTVYTVPEYLFKDYSTKFSEDKHYPSVCVQYGVGDGEWKTINMVKTDYTYDNYPIWKATFLLDYNIFKEFQIKYFDKANSQQVGLYQYNQGGNTEYPSSDLDDKLYHGWNGSSHDFFPYTYDVKLDQQGGSGGTESIKATDGADLPVATMPGRDGYIFGGYYTEVGGNGDMYYDTNGNSSTQWNSRTITTLYAKWTPKPYTVTLEGMEADSDDPILVNVTYDAVLPSLETTHIKAHYDLLGYWAASDDHGMNKTVQLIDANGNWIPDVTGYTGNDGEGHPTWIHDGINISLFADWTEHPYTVTTSVSPAGAGTLSCGSSVTAKWVTPSELITATANPAWKFVRWEYGENVGPATGTGLDNTVQITAAVDGTLRAVFEPRFCLVGSIWDDSDNGGMPGWHDYTADFIVNSYTDLSTMNLTCVRSLDPNTTYKFEVHDKVKGQNLGYSEANTFIADQSLLFNTQTNDVLLRVNGHGECTFTISALSSGDLYPTVSVAIPASHQLNLEWAYVRINGDWYKTSDAVGGTVNAQTTESGRHFDIHNGEYVAHGGDITYTATPATGYTFEGWYNNDYNTRFSTTNPYTSSNIQTTENVEAKFVEKATAVTLSNDGHGHVEIDGMTVSSTTVGVTTTRELTAVPNEGYKFSSWSKSGDDITLSSTSTNLTTLSGNGSGATSGQTVTANFVERYSIKGTMNGENWGTTHTLSNIGTNAGSKDTCYVTMTLPANTTYEFAIYDEQTKGWLKNSTTEVFKMTYGNSSAWPFDTDKTVNCGITTAGRGTYKFIFNITDKTVTVVYPTSYQVNYGATVGGSVTSVLDDDDNVVPNGGYVRKGGSVTYEATASDGYTFTGWCPDDSYGDIFTDHNPWENSSITATSNAYAKFHSTNFVIYRTDDKSSDPRAVWDDVESYDGGTISEIIEFRMKVNKLDFWYTLCLPFEVNAVRVWEDGEYYDIVPYWRPTDSTYCTGHYILRRPVTTTDFAIEGFEGKDRWIDPKSSDVLPSKNIPYIIQWHVDYFQGKYISFFGTAGQTIPTAMDKGSYASSDETVNIYGNNSMTTGTVRDAYLLDPYYGSDGAWMREEIGTDRSVLPFECFILANPATTAKYRVLRRDMADDTPTGLDTLSMTEDSVSKVMINNRIYIIRGGKMYTIQGTFVKEVE